VQILALQGKHEQAAELADGALGDKCLREEVERKTVRQAAGSRHMRMKGAGRWGGGARLTPIMLPC
jgi:hypothetical protein